MIRLLAALIVLMASPALAHVTGIPHPNGLENLLTGLGLIALALFVALRRRS